MQHDPRPMRRVLLLASLLSGATFVAGCAAQPTEDVATGDEQNLTADETGIAALKKAVADVDEEHVVLPEGLAAPGLNAGTGAKTDTTSLFGIDWYQKWAGGKSADHVWTNGSDFGRRCAWASVARFEAIMADPPPELTTFLASYTKWDGSFTNWNDDYGGKTADGLPAYGDAKSARLWAWRSTSSKWISATAQDGSCYLPTRTMVVAFVSACKAQAAAKNGEIQGCEAR